MLANPLALYPSLSKSIRVRVLFAAFAFFYLFCGFGLTPAGRVAAQTFNVLYPFTATSSEPPYANSDGSGPIGKLVLSGNTIYGAAGYGGAAGNGAGFKVNIDGTGYANLHNFTSLSPPPNLDGASPRDGLILSGSTLYGTANGGGSASYGTVFAVSTNGTGYTVLHSFTGQPGGNNPNGRLVLSGNTLFGTTSTSVFKVNTNGTGFVTLYTFAGNPGPHNISAGLVLLGDTLYGTSLSGGSADQGAVFAVNVNTPGVTILHSFTALPPDPGPYTNSDGTGPRGELVLSGNTLYGTASAGGGTGNGTVFAMNTDGGSFRVVHHFTARSGSPSTNYDGGLSYCGLAVSENTLYGTAGAGGAYGWGTVFSVNTDGTRFRTLHNFSRGLDGWLPRTGVILSGRTLYGAAEAGGIGNTGLIFSVSLPPIPFDFDGDGKTDIGIFRPTPAEWWINRSNDGSTFAAQFGTSTDLITPADFTGDGKTDIAIWRPASGTWFVLRSENFSFYSAPFGTTNDVPVPADYDADGKADLAVFRPSNSTWYIQRTGDLGTTIQTFGTTGDRAAPADYDGDGRTDIAIYRPSNGQWWMNRSTAGVLAVTFGNSTDKQVQGDYTGDGKSDNAFWRPSTGEWFILRSEDFSFYSFPFGLSTDTPAPGDYDGDGRFDATVFRPSNSTWYSQRTTAGSLVQQFGISSDRPIPNAFVP